MITAVLRTGVLAGLVAGIVGAVLQALWVTPLIVAAEAFERAAATPAPMAAADGIARLGLTVLANVAVGVGFGLILAAAMVLRGRAIGWRGGLGWGAIGYCVFTLAPALGLPPELPGMAAAALVERQLWWVATVTLTAGGLALAFEAPRAGFRLAGVALVALPHAIGAPQPDGAGAALPPELVARFVAASLGVSALFWAVLGLAAARLRQ